jgi:hypothetical protein
MSLIICPISLWTCASLRRSCAATVCVVCSEREREREKERERERVCVCVRACVYVYVYVDVDVDVYVYVCMCTHTHTHTHIHTHTHTHIGDPHAPAVLTNKDTAATIEVDMCSLLIVCVLFL